MSTIACALLDVSMPIAAATCGMVLACIFALDAMVFEGAGLHATF